MSVYLGNLGRLVEFKCPSSQSVNVDDGTVLKSALEGRVWAEVRPVRVARQWSVGVGAGTPADLANVLAISAGEFGRGPFVWVSADAPVTNLLTPDVSTCGDSAMTGLAVEQAGPLTLADGVAGRSLLNNTPASPLYFGAAIVPVIPSEPVTASAYLVGAGARMAVAFYDAAGDFIYTTTGAAGGVAGSAKRLSVTNLTPPSNAASCVPLGLSATYGARPAVTWTREMFDWQTGEGCPKAVVTGLSRDVILALREPSYGRYSSLSFSVTEVGQTA